MHNNIKNFMKADKNRVIIILIGLLAVTVIFIALFPKFFQAIIFLAIFIIIGIITFKISKEWISTLTIFYVFNFISIGFSMFFVVNENVHLFFNPFLIIFGGFTFLLIGYSYGKTVQHKNIRLLNKHFGNFPLLYFLLVTYLFSSLCWLIYYVKNRSLLSSSGMESGRIEAMRGAGMLIYGTQLHIVTISLLFLELKKKKCNKLLFWTLSIIAWLQMISMGFRSPVAISILIIIIIQLLNGKLNLNKLMPILFIAIIFFSSYGIYRSGKTTTLYFTLRNQFYIQLFNLNRVFDYFPRKIHFQHGGIYFMNYIMLLPGPQDDFTLWLKKILEMQFAGGGVTPTVFGEFFLNFGKVGIFIGLLILGFVLSKIDKWIYEGNITFWKAYLLILIPSCAGGGIANIEIQPLTFLIYYFVLCFISRPVSLESDNKNIKK